MAETTSSNTTERVLNALPDTLDFRDRIFEPTLIEVPERIDLDSYKRWSVPILDQGVEGACTGFALATIAHYLFRRRSFNPDATNVSPRMFYEMAKRYDEWPGEAYDGSSARGAMKGWHRHGVCSESLWPYSSSNPDRTLTAERASDAVGRPLGAYYRVNHKDLIALHCALAEVGILYVTASVHNGWKSVGADGRIPYVEGAQAIGGHAFVIVAYDREGFWIQNSWGSDWGCQGFAKVTYDDWLRNATDVWVARLGAPVTLRSTGSTAVSISAAAGKSDAYAFCTMRSHIVTVGSSGRLKAGGAYGTSEREIADTFRQVIPSTIEEWPKKRILLMAQSGLLGEENGVQRLADYRSALLASHIYPVAFTWKTDLWRSITNILEDAVERRRPEGYLDDSLDFMLDRLDDALEPQARSLTGRAQWEDMTESAFRASIAEDGGARLVLEHLHDLVARYPDIEIHLLAESAGAIFLAPLVQLMTGSGRIDAGPARGLHGLGMNAASCTLWGPACTVELFRESYLPAIDNGAIDRFTLFTLTDRAEQDDHCAGIYHKSLLYLVSNAFSAQPRIPSLIDGEPIVGMEKFVRAESDLMQLFQSGRADWIIAPNGATGSPLDHSTARVHGGFSGDIPTLHATFGRIAGGIDALNGAITVHRSASRLREDRRGLQ